MADRTPPPRSRRVHTPPAPRLGAQDDEWVPFTPRRSSRVAAQRIRPSSHHAFSPPSSPISPSHNTTSLNHSQSKLGKRSLPTPRRSKARALSPASSETEIDGSKLAPHTIFPTPVKTPRKKLFSSEALTSTSRVLFHPRLATVDDAMPTPKKSRRSKALSLNPLEDLQAEQISVYEDSKERVPTVDHDEDNPFIVAPNTRKPRSPAKSRGRKPDRDDTIEEAGRNEEGMVYVFRGKKIFRRFADVEEDDNLSDLDIQRRAGVSHSPRLTRTSIKPKILFPTAEQLLAREAAAADEADEEALTDIEMPRPASKQKPATASASSSRLPKGPIPSISFPSTPVFDLPALFNGTTEGALSGPSSDPVVTEPPANKRLSGHKRGRNSSPFDNWTRTKNLEPPGEPKSNKRQGSPMEKSSKRVRSGSFTAASV